MRSKFKICVIGDSGSGKSSLIRSFIKKPFEVNIPSTQGFEVSLLEFSKNDRNYSIQLWDCGNNFFSLNQYTRRAFFHNTSAVFIAFDITSKQSFYNLPQWLHQSQTNECYLVYLFGMKKDLVQNPDNHQILLFQQENKLLYFPYAATELHQKQVVELFCRIEDDRSFVSRSSLAKGVRYSGARFSQLKELRDSYSIVQKID